MAALSEDPGTVHFDVTEPFGEIEYWLEGLSDDPLPDAYPELPEGYVYPVLGNEGAGTWLTWFGGHSGDAFDTGADFASGAGDNVTFGLSWVIRDKVFGFDTVNYESGAYTTGDRVGTAVSVATGVGGAAKGLFKLATAVDDLGRGANPISRIMLGGCFVPGTLVTLSGMPRVIS